MDQIISRYEVSSVAQQQLVLQFGLLEDFNSMISALLLHFHASLMFADPVVVDKLSTLYILQVSLSCSHWLLVS